MVTSPQTTSEPRAPRSARGRRRDGEGRRHSGWATRDAWSALVFIAPNVTLFTVFILIPVIVGLGLSLFEWDLISTPRWVGLDNYVRLFNDPEAVDSLTRTILFMLGGVVPTVLLGLAIAVLLNTRFPGIEAVRTLYYMPLVVSFVASAVLWRWIYDPGLGLFTWLLALIGIDAPAWLSDTTWALPSLVLVLVWLSLPLSVILYLAALQRIPDVIMEAARIDGAGAWSRLRHIIWPSVRPATLLVTVVMMLSFAFGSFDLVAVMTQGGPLQSTNILVYYMYDVAFNRLEMGYASALAVFQFVVIFGFTGVLLYYSRRGET